MPVDIAIIGGLVLLGLIFIIAPLLLHIGTLVKFICIFLWGWVWFRDSHEREDFLFRHLD